MNPEIIEAVAAIEAAPVPEIEAPAAAVPELEPPGGILVDAWATPLDWGHEFNMETRISLVDGAVRGEAFVLVEQCPDGRIFLGPDEVQRAINALSVALVAMRGFDPQAAEVA